MRRAYDHTALDTYIKRTYHRVTVGRQAELAGVSTRTIRLRREVLAACGKISPHKRAAIRLWSREEEEQLDDLLVAGLPMEEIALQIRRSVKAIQKRRNIRDARSGIEQVRTASGVARLFGINEKRITGWIQHGWLFARKNSDLKRAKYLIADQAILAFIHDRRTWLDWSPIDIIEPEWMDVAVRARFHADGYWMRLNEVAEHFHYHPSHVRKWACNGVLAATKHSDAWFVWSADLDRFTPPEDRRFR